MRYGDDAAQTAEKAASGKGESDLTFSVRLGFSVRLVKLCASLSAFHYSTFYLLNN